MDCVVWATEKAKDCHGDSEGDENDEDDTCSEDEEGILQDKEKEELRCFTLASSLPEDKLKNHHSNLGSSGLRKHWQNASELAGCLAFSQKETKTW